MRSLKPSEHQIQSAYFDWVRMKRSGDWRYNLVFAIPNGSKMPFTKKVNKKGETYRHCPQAKKMLREGLTPGVSDVLVAIPARSSLESGSVSYPYHGLFLEFKVEGNGATKEQLLFMETARRAGYFTALAYSFEVAKAYTEEWMARALT